MDSTIDSGPDNAEPDSDDLQVSLDTLALDGVRPKVGDMVDLKVSGKISGIVNDTASVTPETINGQPIPAEPPDEMDQLEQASQGVPTAGNSGY